MMKKITLLFCLGLIFACERAYDENEFLGNSLNDQFGELKFSTPLSASGLEYNFIQVSQYNFNATWSKNANYELRIIGENSNAIKSYTGYDNSLNADNSIWRGEANDFPSFKEESCQVILSVSDLDTTIYDTLNIYINETKPMQPGVYIIQDFENIDQATLMQNSFVQFGANMDFNIQNDFAAQGQNYFRMRGEMTWNEWFLGNLVLDIDEAQTLPNLTPSTTYFNIAVVGSRQELFPEDQFLEIVIRETDGDEFRTQIRPIEWSSWRNFSIPYSEFESGSDIAIKETNKINQIEILCLSCPGVVGSQGGCVNNQGVLVTTDIDFISFTENEPYQP